MTFLFKNNVFVLFLVPLLGLTHSKTQFYNLTATDNSTPNIKLTWAGELSNDEIIEIQRSLHNQNNYTSLMLSDVQKRELKNSYLDHTGLKPKPIYYDYRICSFKNGNQSSAWSNIAVGAIIPVAQGDLTMKLVPCSATVNLNEIRNIEGGYQLFYKHQHDCGQVHDPQVFLSKDDQLDDTDKRLRTLSKTDTTISVLIGKHKTEGGQSLILKIGNQNDALKIKQ
jgi:hypothetical protein